jgi:2-methylcitrate dehydratase PrpD
MAGVGAALLAARGFTGAPAVTVEAPEVAHLWSDAGSAWLIGDQYFKPYAVCYWAQPAISGALALQRVHRLPPEAIARIRVHTFEAATRLACRRPQSTEEAQYSLPYPVAAALVHGRLGLDELSGAALGEPRALRLAECVELEVDPLLDARFPSERWARVQIETTAGAILDAGAVRAMWDEAPPTDDELRAKFRWLAGTPCGGDSLSEERAAALEEAVWHCAELPDAARLVEVLAPLSSTR